MTNPAQRARRPMIKVFPVATSRGFYAGSRATLASTTTGKVAGSEREYRNAFDHFCAGRSTSRYNKYAATIAAISGTMNAKNPVNEF